MSTHRKEYFKKLSESFDKLSKDNEAMIYQEAVTEAIKGLINDDKEEETDKYEEEDLDLEKEKKEEDKDDSKSKNELDDEEWEEFEHLKDEETGEYDLSKVEDDEEVIRILKLMKKEDGVKVVKNEEDNTLTFTDENNEETYIIDLGHTEKKEEKDTIKEDKLRFNTYDYDLSDFEDYGDENMKTNRFSKNKTNMKRQGKIEEAGCGFKPKFGKRSLQEEGSAKFKTVEQVRSELSRKGKTNDDETVKESSCGFKPKFGKRNLQEEGSAKFKTVEQVRSELSRKGKTNDDETVKESSCGIKPKFGRKVNEDSCNINNESTSVGGMVQAHSTVKTHGTNNITRPIARNGSVAGVKAKSTSTAMYESLKLKAIEEKAKKVFNENIEIKKLMSEMSDKLQEAINVNAQLGMSVKLFLENATTKDEKKQIIDRLSKAKTLQESKDIYKQIEQELKQPKSSNTILENVLINEASNSNKIVKEVLNETQGVSKMRNLLDRITKIK